MRAAVASAISITFLATGCTTTRHMGPSLTTDAEHTIRNETRSRDQTRSANLRVIAVASPGGPEWLVGTVHYVTPTGTHVRGEGGTAYLIPNENVRRIEHRNRGRGAFDGLLLGAGAGAVVGLGVGATSGCQAKIWGECADFGPAIVVSSVLLGAIIGAVVGAASGHVTRYQFGPSSP
jgi:hypothetical protein